MAAVGHVHPGSTLSCGFGLQTAILDLSLLVWTPESDLTKLDLNRGLVFASTGGQGDPRISPEAGSPWAHPIGPPATKVNVDPGWYTFDLDGVICRQLEEELGFSGIPVRGHPTQRRILVEASMISNVSWDFSCLPSQPCPQPDGFVQGLGACVGGDVARTTCEGSVASSTSDSPACAPCMCDKCRAPWALTVNNVPDLWACSRRTGCLSAAPDTCRTACADEVAGLGPLLPGLEILQALGDCVTGAGCDCGL